MVGSGPCSGKPVVGPALWSNSFLPGVYQGCHIQNLDPKRVIDHIQNRYLGSDSQRQQLDLLNELNRLHLDRRNGDDQLDARIQSLEMAFRMQTEATEAFDVSREPMVWTLPTACAPELQLAAVHRAVRAGFLLGVRCWRAELLSCQRRECAHQRLDRGGLPMDRLGYRLEVGRDLLLVHGSAAPLIASLSAFTTA